MYKQYKKKLDSATNFHLDFPKKLFKNDFAFTMDFGGSAIKMLYTTSEAEDKIRVHFVTFPREKHEEAFEDLYKNCHGKLPPGTDVNTCGLGGSEFHDLLSEKFGLNFVNTNEMDRMLEGFQFLSRHLSWEDFVKPPMESALAKASAQASTHKVIMGMMGDEKYKAPDYAALTQYQTGHTDPTPHEVQYPLLIFLVGSGGGAMKVNEDGTYEFCDSSTMAGRAFLGLGSLLTDGKGFPEICALAKAGDSGNVDSMLDSFELNSGNPNDAYSAVNTGEVPPQYKVYAFGNAAGKNKEEFATSDVSAALVSLFAEAFASRAYIWSDIHKVKQVFFVGGFASTQEVIQENIAECFNRKKFMSSTGHMSDVYFTPYGQHFGSLGTLLTNLGLKDD